MSNDPTISEGEAMTQRATPAPDATVAADYADEYYGDYGGGHLGGIRYSYDEPEWKAFFGGIAERLVALFDPSTSYDAGCAKGFLVRAMAELGVDARGGDISTHAIEGAPPGLAERLEVRDLTQPFTDRYDLISCIEVLEHMSAPDARAAVVNLCQATDVILMSSTPLDYDEPTHVNVRPQAQWAQDFAVSGFFRRTDIDASFVAPWAVIYQRATPTAVQLVGSYESMLAPLTMEVTAKRRALLEAQRDLTEAKSPVNAAVGKAIDERNQAQAGRDQLEAERDRLLARIQELGAADLEAERLTRLALADELIGARAELALVRIQAENSVVEAGREAVRLREMLDATQADLDSTRSHAAGLERMVADVRASTTWRIARMAMLPVRVARLPVRAARRVAARVKRILAR